MFFTSEISDAQNGSNFGIQKGQNQIKWQEFTLKFQEIVNPNSHTGTTVKFFLNKHLRLYRIGNLYTYEDILNEVLIRAHKLVNGEGVAILQPVAWVKTTGWNVIRELHRREKKSVNLTEGLLERAAGITLPPEDLTDFAFVNQALETLDSHEKRLLQLKLIDCLSWGEIQAVFRSEGYDYTEAALRKKKQRVLNKLRRSYENIKRA